MINTSRSEGMETIRILAMQTGAQSIRNLLLHWLRVLPPVVLLAATACVQDISGLPVEVPSPEPTPSRTEHTSSIQGFLEFPYVSADAGNFSLQAGERISITWIQAPPDADKYELVLINSDEDITQTIALNHPSTGDVQAIWLVPPELSGKLEARAYFNDGHVVRSGCCAQVYTNKLPPEEICSLRTAGIAPQHLYTQPDPESARLIGIAPGLYLEVLARSTGGWYLVRALPGGEPGEQPNSGVTGWLPAPEEAKLFGPCEDLPLESNRDDQQQGIQDSDGTAG